MNGRDSTPRSKGHLNPASSPPIARYAAPSDLGDLVRHFWIPEWELPDGEVATARVLGYPSLNLVVDASGVVLSGPTRVASERRLEGSGWAVGVLLQPAATLALGYDGAAFVDSVRPLEEPGLVRDVTAAMTRDAGAEDRHLAATVVLTDWLRERLRQVGDHGLLANAAVALVERDPSITKVGQIATALAVTPRTLQRAVRECTGFSPAEVVRRRRLQDATDRLNRETTALSDVAHDVGYADHAHMTREFRQTLSQTPSAFRRAGRSRKARVEDVHETALAMPHVTVDGSPERPVYQVGGRSFVFFRSRRPDAFDPVTGERYADVIVFWVADEGEKTALVEDPTTPYFTTPHFAGHPSVLLRASRIGELARDEVVELVQDAWLCRASARRARQWLASLDGSDPRFVAPRR